MSAPDSAPPALRLLSYNVRSLRDDADAVARVIRSTDAHVVCVQEAPRLLRWRSACAALARRSGLVVVTGGRTAAGNLILCSLGVEVLARADVLLSRDPGLHQRGVALAALRWRGHAFTVAGTHLDLEPEPRRRHAGELADAVSTFAGDTPTVISGDLNDEPGSPSWLALLDGRQDAFAAAGGGGSGFTFTAANPQRRIDGVFVADAITVRSAAVLDGADVLLASDHRPVLVELELN
jgi:endonuclease/exonuclease/phosphatase family metal-dependent hydrolase